MPNDAELRRTGISFTRAFTATAMCSPSRASLLTGTLSVAPRRDADAHRGRPVPRPPQRPRRAAHGRPAVAQRRGAARGGSARGVPARAAAAGAEERQRARAAARHRHARDAAARARLPRGAQGQVAPVEAGATATGAPPTRERIERDYGFADWEPPDAGGDAKAETLRRRQRRARPATGWDEDYTRQVERWLGRARPARAVLPGVLAGQPARRARLPVVVRARRLHGRPVPAAGRAAAADASTRTCATSRPSTR